LTAETPRPDRFSGLPTNPGKKELPILSPIRTPVGVEAETFVPMAKQLSDEAFEAKVKEIFGLR
jgi:hypothetical protein